MVVLICDGDNVIGSGVELDVLNDEQCLQLMRDFMAEKLELWNEDIGV